MRRSILYILTCLIMACNAADEETQSIELINTPGSQDSIFQALMRVTNNGVADNLWDDSLSFLILPVQASCPSCRSKTIDSIMKYKNNLPDGHFVIISAKGGRKTMNSYFRKEKVELPENKEWLFLDSINAAYTHRLYDNKPTAYYTYNRMAYKRVAAIPATVRQDLQEFFSGYRTQKSK